MDKRTFPAAIVIFNIAALCAIAAWTKTKTDAIEADVQALRNQPRVQSGAPSAKIRQTGGNSIVEHDYSLYDLTARVDRLLARLEKMEADKGTAHGGGTVVSGTPGDGQDVSKSFGELFEDALKLEAKKNRDKLVEALKGAPTPQQEDDARKEVEAELGQIDQALRMSAAERQAVKAIVDTVHKQRETEFRALAQSGQELNTDLVLAVMQKFYTSQDTQIANAFESGRFRAYSEAMKAKRRWETFFIQAMFEPETPEER
jgi:hypothetical protein